MTPNTKNADAAPTVRIITLMYITAMGHIKKCSQMRFRSAVEKWILPMIGSIPINHLTAQDLQKVGRNYFNALSPHNQPHSLGGYRSVLVYLKAIINFAIRQGLIKSSPVKIIPPKEHRPVPIMVPYDFDAFLQAVNSITESFEIRLAIRMYLLLGLRPKEAFDISWNMFSSDFQKLRLISPRGNKNYCLIVPLLIKNMLDAKNNEIKNRSLQSTIPFNDAKIIQSNSMRYMAYKINYIIKLSARTVGLIGNFTPHSLRYSCILAGFDQRDPSRAIIKHIYAKNHYPKRNNIWLNT